MAVKQRSNKYWARRAEEGLNKALKTSASYERLINRVYTEASINLTQELQRLYRNAYKGDKSFDMDKLNALEPSGNVERFKAAMRRQGLYRELPDNYKGRLTRLEMLDAQIWAEVKRAGQKETAYNTDAYRKIVNNGYKNAQSVIAKGTNTSFTFNKLNTGAVNTILNNKFDGANYSERIWGQTDVLANELQQKLATAVATGQNYERTAREFRERFNVKKSYAERLIRTESCYFETEAKLQAYKDLGITELVFVATLDSRTSEICQHADGERIKISEAVVGENIPPLHPNCRSTVRAYIAEEFEPTERIARNADERNVYVQQQTYEEWAKANPTVASNGSVPPPSNNPIVAHFDNTAKAANIDYLDAKEMVKQPTEEEIISKLAGGDLTEGSCASLALAYAANKNGWDVLDFRGGISRGLFSRNISMVRIGNLDKAIKYSENNYDAFKAASKVLANIKAGSKHEYILSVSRHTAVVKRLSNGNYMYLELQSGKGNNGWHELTLTALRQRFGCTKQRTIYGERLKQEALLVDINSFKGNQDFRHIMGYINTKAGNQRKGQKGNEK